MMEEKESDAHLSDKGFKQSQIDDELNLKTSYNREDLFDESRK